MSQQLLPTATGVRGHTPALASQDGCDHRELVCASTHRLIDLKDMWRRVEVSAELVDKYVETADLLSHGAGYLDETELSVSCRTCALHSMHRCFLVLLY